MKRFLILIIVSIVSVALLWGCTSNDVATEGEEGSSGNDAKDGGTLVVVRSADAETLDPHFSNSLNAPSIYHENIYEGLIKRDKNMDFQPSLAEEWEQLDDTTWEFKLREGVLFHDGTEFNAESVKATFERILNEEVASPKASLFSFLKEVKAVDGTTVQFMLNEPYAPLLSILASHEGGIISPAAIEKYGKDLGQNPVGTGLFKFESWNPGQEINIVRNEDYWGEKAKIEKAVFKVVPEGATRIAMVETGEAHIAEPIPYNEIERITASDKMELYRSDAIAVNYMGFNFNEKPFDDVRVRQAVNYAINQDPIIKGVFQGVGKKGTSVTPENVFGHHPGLKEYEYDINKAKELLKEAGYKDGFKTTLWTWDRKDLVDLAEVLQSQLKGIGIEVEVVVNEFAAFTAAAASGETGMFIYGWGNATADADYMQYHVFHSSAKGAPGNYFFYENPEIDKLIEEGRKEQDVEKRKEIYAKIQEIEQEDAVFVPIWFRENVAAISKDIDGLYMNPVTYLMVKDVYMK